MLCHFPCAQGFKLFAFPGGPFAGVSATFALGLGVLQYSFDLHRTNAAAAMSYIGWYYTKQQGWCVAHLLQASSTPHDTSPICLWTDAAEIKYGWCSTEQQGLSVIRLLQASSTPHRPESNLPLDRCCQSQDCLVHHRASILSPPDACLRNSQNIITIIVIAIIIIRPQQYLSSRFETQQILSSNQCAGIPQKN